MKKKQNELVGTMSHVMIAMVALVAIVGISAIFLNARAVRGWEAAWISGGPSQWTYPGEAAQVQKPSDVPPATKSFGDRCTADSQCASGNCGGEIYGPSGKIMTNVKVCI